MKRPVYRVLGVCSVLLGIIGAVLHEWALAGKGLAWRSLWEVGQDMKEGRLTSVLDAWQAPPMGIYAVFPQRRHLPLRVRVFIDLLKETYSRPSYWELT